MEQEKMKKHEIMRRRIRIFGALGLSLGVFCLIAGFVDFFSAIRGERMPSLFWLFLIGVPLSGFGGMALLFGFRGALLRYSKNEGIPVLREIGRELTPGVRDLGAALHGGGEEENLLTRCACGARNERESRYCGSCGRLLFRECPHCGKRVAAENRFCNHCGEKLD